MSAIGTSGGHGVTTRELTIARIKDHGITPVNWTTLAADHRGDRTRNLVRIVEPAALTAVVMRVQVAMENEKERQLVWVASQVRLRSMRRGWWRRGVYFLQAGPKMRPKKRRPKRHLRHAFESRFF